MGRLTAPVGWRPWIEEQQALLPLVHGDVGMPEHHRLSSGKPAPQPCGPALARAAVVHHTQGDALPAELEPGWQRQPLVVVSENGMDRSDLPQSIQEFRRQHVAGVDDRVDAIQVLIRFGRKVASPLGDVGIR